MLTNTRQAPLATKGERSEENVGQFRGGASNYKGKKVNLGEMTHSIYIVETEEQA